MFDVVAQDDAWAEQLLSGSRTLSPSSTTMASSGGTSLFERIGEASGSGSRGARIHTSYAVAACALAS